MRLILLLLITVTVSAQQKDSLITKEKAISIVEEDIGLAGSTVETEFKNKQWHVTMFYLSSKPPAHYVVNAANGKILLRLNNADDPAQKARLKKFNAISSKQGYYLPQWVEDTTIILTQIALAFAGCLK